MLSIHPHQTTYNGWDISITPLEDEFYFECYAPNFDNYCNDGVLYRDAATALAAAQEFVKRETAIQSLISVANDWLESGYVSEDEYWQITDFA